MNISYDDLRTLAKENSGSAQFELAHDYEVGYRVLKDRRAALRLYADAYSNGAKEGAVAAGKLCEVLGEHADAAVWYEKAVSDGCMDGFWRLGILVEEGTGVPKDLAKARKLYEKACEYTTNSRAGKKIPLCKVACWRLGRMYELGLGGILDTTRAKEYYGSVLHEYHSDWVRGPEWAELYYRYAELISKDGSPYCVLDLYEGAAKFNYPGACEAYVNYWLEHKDDEGDRYPHPGNGSSLVIRAALAGNLAALQFLAPTNHHCAWKLFRMGKKEALQHLISHYDNSDKTVEDLKGRRLCAILKKREQGDKCVRASALNRKEMLAAFVSAVSNGSDCPLACYKIYKWAQEGLLTTGRREWNGNRNESVWLKKAIDAKFGPAIEERQRIDSERKEAAFREEISNRQAGKASGSYYLDKDLYPRVVSFFTELANKGDAVACNVMAEMFRCGDYGVKKNESEYQKWLIEAANAGNEESMREACKLPIRKELLYKISTKLSDYHDVTATLRCAEMLEKGEGCVSDIKAAVAMYERIGDNVLSQRELYRIYTTGLAIPSRSARIQELKDALVIEDGIDTRASAKNALYAIFTDHIPVENFSSKIKKVIDKGTSLVSSYYSGYGGGWSGRRYYEPLFVNEPDFSWLPGRVTDFLLCLYGRQMESSRCKECLSRLYSLSAAKNLSAYQKELREETISEMFEDSILKTLDCVLFKNGYLRGTDIDTALSTSGIQPNRIYALLRILEYYGLPLYEGLVVDKDGLLQIHEAYQERFIKEHIRKATETLCAHRRDHAAARLKKKSDAQYFEEDERECSSGETVAEVLGKESLYWLRRYSDKGDSRASYVCGQLYMEGAGVSRNFNLAERYFSRCIESFPSEVFHELGLIQKNKQSAAIGSSNNLTIALFRSAIDANSEKSTALMGDLCFQHYLAKVVSNKSFIEFDQKVLSAMSQNGCKILSADDVLSQTLLWYKTGADKNDPCSLFKYGICLIKGLSCRSNVKLGNECVMRALQGGCADAAVYAALQHWCLPRGFCGERDIVLRYLRIAARLGSERGRILLSQYREGFWRPHVLDNDDDSLMSEWPIGLCNSGFHSCDMLRDSLSNILTRADKGSACEMFKVGCKLFHGSNDDGCYMMSGEDGLDNEADPVRAQKYFEHAAVMGYVPAITMLGAIAEKKYGFNRGKDVAYRYFKLASQLGDGYAGWKLYKQRVGELKEGIWTSRALSGSDSALDIWSVGYCLENAIWGTKDLVEAVAHYEVAAQRGFTPAIVSFGKCLMSGLGVRQNIRRAYSYFAEAAARGDIGGIYFLGTCYEYGYGCEIDKKTAYMLYVEAARQGNAHAKLGAARIVIEDLSRESRGRLYDNDALEEYGDGEYTRNSIVAESVILPHQYFSIYSPVYKSFDVRSTLNELVAIGVKDANALLKRLPTEANVGTKKG